MTLKHRVAHQFIHVALTIKYIHPSAVMWLLDNFSIVRLKDIMDDEVQKI